MRKNLFRIVFYLTVILVCSVVFLLFLWGNHLRMDSEPPVISFSEELLEISASDPREALLRGVTATDAVDGDVTDSLVVAQLQLLDKDGSVRVTYAAFDAAGNVTKAVRKAKFTDYVSPRFSLNTSLTFSYNTQYDLFSMVKAEDMLDGDISHRVRITTLDDTSITTLGTHRVKVDVTNSLGHTVTLELPVEIYAASTYAATLKLTDYLVYLPVGAELDVNAYLESYVRGTAAVSLEDGIPEGIAADVKSNVDTEVPGAYTVEYRVSETVNGRSYTGYAKLIVVVEG